MQIGIALSLLALVWSVAVVIKLLTARPYTFSQWDGGLMWKGKTLGAGGRAALTVFTLAIGAIATWQLVRWSQL